MKHHKIKPAEIYDTQILQSSQFIVVYHLHFFFFFLFVKPISLPHPIFGHQRLKCFSLELNRNAVWNEADDYDSNTLILSKSFRFAVGSIYDESIGLWRSKASAWELILGSSSYFLYL